MPLWTIHMYDQGQLFSTDVIEEAEVESMTAHFQRLGYEVRAEPAWDPVTKAVQTPAANVNQQEQKTIEEAIGILETRLRNPKAFSSPSDVREFCRLHIALETEEYFCCLFLDSQHRLIAFERLFRGSVGAAAVYPRVVVRRALELNAGALIIAHNHPSGLPKPSSADTKITQQLKEILDVVDVRVLDHVIVGTEGVESMAEAGLV